MKPTSIPDECKYHKTESCSIINCKIYHNPSSCYLSKKTEELARQGIRSSPSELIEIILDSLNNDAKDVILGAEGLN